MGKHLEDAAGRTGPRIKYTRQLMRQDSARMIAAQRDIIEQMETPRDQAIKYIETAGVIASTATVFFPQAIPFMPAAQASLDLLKQLIAKNGEIDTNTLELSRRVFEEWARLTEKEEEEEPPEEETEEPSPEVPPHENPTTEGE